MNEKSNDSFLLVNSIIEGIFEKKGENIVKLDLRKLENSVCDYFIICHGTSETHVDSIADSIVTTVKKQIGEKPHHLEGLDNCLWALLDYGNVVVHVFQESQRDFYNLEGLWADAVTERVNDAVNND